MYESIIDVRGVFMISSKIEQKFYYERSKGKFVMPSKHYHNLYEIYFLEKGSGNYFIDDKSYDIQAGDLVFIQPGTVHKTMYDDIRVRHVIYCSKHFIPESVLETMSGMFPVYRNPGIEKDIKDFFFKIEKEYYEKNVYSADLMRCFFQMMLIHIAKHKNESILLNVKNDIVSEVAEFIKSNLQNQLSLSMVAEKYAITPQYLSALFKKKTGIGFQEYVYLLRMLKAEELLKSRTKISIADVSERCGFNDSNYFSFMFKKNFGITPSEMRKKYIKY